MVNWRSLFHLQFVNWTYTKLHGVDLVEFTHVSDILNVPFYEYLEKISHLDSSNTPINSVPNHQIEVGNLSKV